MPHTLLAAAGGLRREYEQVDWAATPVGPMASWSPALRTTLELAFQTRFPVTLLWGPEFVLLYNAAYVEMIADKHPDALGRPARDVFPEAWDAIGPLMASVLGGHGATWVEDAPLPLVRRGRLEEAYFTFSYSPVHGEDGPIEGVLDIAVETTRQVIDRRRLATLGRLREALSDAERVQDAFRAAVDVLRANVADMPSVAIELGRPGFSSRRDWRFPIGEATDEDEQPVLTIRLSEHLAPDSTYFGFLRLVASTINQAVDRIRVRQAQEAVGEALQRSLLTDPPAVPGLEIAVRYRPAGQRARVGGDWYDAFRGPAGELNLVVGDVTGHDQQSVAAMGQMRSLLRGVSWTLETSPAGVLSALDRAVDGLDVGTYATALLARVSDGALVWSNAGHPPPVLRAPDGAVRLLSTTPNPPLGIAPGLARADHRVGLPAGAAVVFYTDGLVERRAEPIDDRLAWLVDVVAGGGSLPAEALADLVLAAAGEDLEDDVALLVLREVGWTDP